MLIFGVLEMYVSNQEVATLKLKVIVDNSQVLDDLLVAVRGAHLAPPKEPHILSDICSLISSL